MPVSGCCHNGLKMKITKPLTFVLVVVAILWSGWAFLVTRPNIPFVENRVENMDARGQFGDSFGALNALLTALTFGGLAFSIYLQVEEAKKRHAEDTARKARDAEERVDSHFFQLTTSLRSMVQATQIYDTGVYPIKASTGRAAFETMFIHVIRERDMFGMYDSLAKTTAAYVKIYDVHQAHLGPYFRLLYRICRYVDQAPITEGQKLMYMKIARAELSNPELSLMALGVFTPLGRNFKDLIDKYALLKHLSRRAIGKTTFTTITEKFQHTAFTDADELLHSDDEPRSDTPPSS